MSASSQFDGALCEDIPRSCFGGATSIVTGIFDLVIFGGTGDLSRKKLLPALFEGWQSGRVSKQSRIVVTSRSELGAPKKEWLAGILSAHSPAGESSDEDIAAFADLITILKVTPSSKDPGWSVLADLLNVYTDRPVTHFMAIPPHMFTGICQLLADHGLNQDRHRVVLEKPLGQDLESAQEINETVARFFSEQQTFRIDHYLGKDAVQNLLALRFSNILFEQLWNNQTIDHVQITIAEDLGLQGRGAYYEGIGALRDMVQNHLLQLLCLIAMEPPAILDASGIREEKLKVLKSLRAFDKDTIGSNVILGQYSEGAMAGQAVGSYLDDLKLESSHTETYVAIKAHIDNWRWAGVPFFLRTGKRLPSRFAEIVLQFKPIPHNVNPDWTGRIRPNRFIIRLQPEDHLALRMMVKNHGDVSKSLKEVELNLDVSETQRLGPYLRLILAACTNDQSLFVHRDEVEASWSWIDGILNQWQQSGASPIPYAAGTWGPYEAHDLMRRENRKWFLD